MNSSTRTRPFTSLTSDRSILSFTEFELWRCLRMARRKAGSRPERVAYQARCLTNRAHTAGCGNIARSRFWIIRSGCSGWTIVNGTGQKITNRLDQMLGLTFDVQNRVGLFRFRDPVFVE